MIFTKEQKENVQQVKLWEFYRIGKDGKPVDKKSKREYLDLRWDQIRRRLINQLENLGYEVTFVKPSQANCVVRVFNDVKTYEGGTQYRIWGGNCFVKDTNGAWMSKSDSGNQFELNYEQHEIKVWFLQDESWDVKVNFFDTYVKLKKRK